MKILVLTDMILREDAMAKGISASFPKAEVRYLRWPPDSRDVFSRENLNIETNGAEVGTPVPGILEAVSSFDPQVIITQFAPITRAVIEKSHALEVIGCLRGGVENVNVEAATRKNVLVFNNSGRTANAVAELTVGLMLAASRGISVGHHTLLNGQWWRPEVTPSEICGSTVGLVGFGNVAQKVAERLQGFKANILACDPYVPEDIISKYGAKRVGLKELLGKADFVCLHSRLTDETRNLIGEKELKLMKPTAYLINTARAGLIDKTALINALKSRQIKGAALDVFWQEPLSPDDPLIKLDNVNLTPHLAGGTVETRARTISLFLEALQEFLKARQSRSIVNFGAAEQAKIAGTMKLVSGWM